MSLIMEVAKRKRHCNCCGRAIPKDEACGVWESPTMKLFGRRSFCEFCLVDILKEVKKHNDRLAVDK